MCVHVCTCSYRHFYVELQSVIYSRQLRLSERIPSGLQAVKASQDGNCLFHSVSIALFGSEEKSALLRLASVCHAIEHYLKMVCIKFLYTVVIRN